MKIVNQSIGHRSQKINFASVNLVQVAKDARDFEGLSVSQISNRFDAKVMSRTLHVPNFITTVMRRLGVTGKSVCSYLEYPDFVEYMEAYSRLEKSKNRWLDFALQATPDIKPSTLDENNYSFYVYTNEHAPPVYNLLKQFPQEVDNIQTATLIKFYARDLDLEKDTDVMDKMIVFGMAKARLIYERSIAEICKDAPVQHFKIDSLSRIPAVFDQIDF